MDEDVLHITNEVSIARAELSFHFSRSSGPGGQHAQKSSTRVELRFDVMGSPSLSKTQKERVVKRLPGYVDSVGILHLASQSERSQMRNREEVVERFETLMRQAVKRRKRRKPTRPTAASKERRLQRKRRRSETKQRRAKVRREV
jgi:ribosome-associated protein